MDDEDQFLSQMLSGISEADVITIFFPLLRRALVVDTRHDDETAHMVKVVPQVSSMEERILAIEKMRPQFGKVRSILGIPWLKPVRSLGEQGIISCVAQRLAEAGMPASPAERAINEAIERLAKLERMAFVGMIRGEGYKTMWASSR